MDAKTVYEKLKGEEVYYKDTGERLVIAGYSGAYLILGFKSDNGCILSFNESKVVLDENVEAKSYRFAKVKNIRLALDNSCPNLDLTDWWVKTTPPIIKDTSFIGGSDNSYVCGPPKPNNKRK